MRTSPITAASLLAGLLSLSSAQILADSLYDENSSYAKGRFEESYSDNFQVFLGVLELDDQSSDWPPGSAASSEVEFGTLPSGGLESEYVFYRGWLHAGLNPGGSIAWKNDDIRVSGSFSGAGGTLISAEADNSLLLAELHLGAFVRGRLQDRITAYAAGGPMLLYGYLEVKDEFLNGEPADPALAETDAWDFNLGFYARAGIDFEYRQNRHMGLGVRYLYSELDFDDTFGNLDIQGVQWVFTFSRHF